MQLAAPTLGQVLDAHEAMMELTLAIVAKTLFDAEVEAEVKQIGDAMNISVGMFTRAMLPFGPLLNYLPLPGNFRFQKARRLLRDTLARFVEQRRASGAAIPVGCSALFSCAALFSRSIECPAGRAEG